LSQTPDPVVITSDALSAEIALKGAQLQRLVTSAGQDLQWDGDPRFWKGRAPILFPVIGLLNGGHYRLNGETIAMPKHGFARDFDFTLAARKPDSVTFRLTADQKTSALYPFQFELEIAYALKGARLDVEARIINGGAAPMPASFGFHPALRWPLPFGEARAEHRILFEQDEPGRLRRIDTDGLLIPDFKPSPIEGRTLTLRDDYFEDDALIFDQVRSRRVLYGADNGPQLAVSFPDFAILGVWTKPGAGFICIEPWAGLPDPEGFEGELVDKPGIFIVPPGATHRLAMSIELVAAPS